MIPRSRSLSMPVALVGLCSLVTGCQMGHQPDYAQVEPGPLVYDEAMALRDWPRTSAYYASGNTVAGPAGPNLRWRVGQASQAGYQERNRMAIVADPLLFIGNTLLLPAWLIANPPTQQREYQAHMMGPTYSAVVPPEQVNEGLRWEGQDLRLMQEQAERPPEPRHRGRAARAPDPVVPIQPPEPPDPIPAFPAPTPEDQIYIPLDDLLRSLPPRF